ncbi:hypothetical protein SESBI_28488 [Sesbania bispinosa]|nr:hypothetical protein SESBI_28488 [Sesbania bispinosa]
MERQQRGCCQATIWEAWSPNFFFNTVVEFPIFNHILGFINGGRLQILSVVYILNHCPNHVKYIAAVVAKILLLSFEGRPHTTTKIVG